MRRGKRNRTLSCSEYEKVRFGGEILRIEGSVTLPQIINRAILADTFEVAHHLPPAFADLLILDPPYNLSKNFNGTVFREKEGEDYTSWFDRLIRTLKPSLKPNATIYCCSDWRTSTLIFPVLKHHFYIRNRITWEREKGRGAKTNWKNNTEDIWFCTLSKEYFFNVEEVKLKRRVIAPYKENGRPKDWNVESNGKFRLTYPSNIWTDITIPFWSMPENTDHPTQKPEKLFAKLVLASSVKGDCVFDPFLGSGTTASTCTKLQRHWVGIDINEEYLRWSLKRVHLARGNKEIQGYKDNVFWERNSLQNRK